MAALLLPTTGLFQGRINKYLPAFLKRYSLVIAFCNNFEFPIPIQCRYI